MEGHDLLTPMTKVKAPEGFEDSVLRRLPAARRDRAKARRLAAYRYALSGAAALVVAGFLVFGPSPEEPETVLTSADRLALTATPDFGRGEPPSRSPVLPVFETMDYSSEFRGARSQARTVYILEQVSDAVRSEIIY